MMNLKVSEDTVFEGMAQLLRLNKDPVMLLLMDDFWREASAAADRRTVRAPALDAKTAHSADNIGSNLLGSRSAVLPI